ncbi:MAG: CAP domain-containing protein [Eubacteriales bacterium]|nr:CAP domain-containing protein [Eubacteriales bacterium]MDD3880831.1 CAP domain-containing protein [Eubacteriales bacterium]MDD4511802.1 CAP domain-containing protein [Eubacteriales bacterium]
MNEDRVKNGMQALPMDAELARIARIKAEDMRDNGYFAHESPTYGKMSVMLKTMGYAFTAAGENIAHHASVLKAEAAFMSSAGHKRNILSASWTKVGIGIAVDKNGYIYECQVFAR